LGKKFVQILEKVAKTIAKPKNAKVFSSKLNFKVPKVFAKPLLNSLDTYNKQYFPQKNLPEPLKNSPNGEILPNLVTLFACFLDLSLVE
jgi:hypothetical protein